MSKNNTQFYKNRYLHACSHNVGPYIVTFTSAARQTGLIFNCGNLSLAEQIQKKYLQDFSQPLSIILTIDVLGKYSLSLKCFRGWTYFTLSFTSNMRIFLQFLTDARDVWKLQGTPIIRNMRSSHEIIFEETLIERGPGVKHVFFQKKKLRPQVYLK